MRVVYYSMIDYHSRRDQFLRSVESLRRYNQTIPVYLFLMKSGDDDAHYFTANDALEIKQDLERLNVNVRFLQWSS